MRVFGRYNMISYKTKLESKNEYMAMAILKPRPSMLQRRVHIGLIRNEDREMVYSIAKKRCEASVSTGSIRDTRVRKYEKNYGGDAAVRLMPILLSLWTENDMMQEKPLLRPRDDQDTRHVLVAFQT